MSSTRVYTDTTRLNRLIERIPGNTETVIKTIAFMIEALAKMKAPVDTGALRSSIYVATHQSNNPPSEATESLPNPSTRFSAVIGPSVEYGIHQELGTSQLDAQPYMIPALREVERQLEDGFRPLADGNA
jgi:hypothetical protein